MERRRLRQRHARADGFGRGGAATAWAAAALSARARRLCAARARSGAQGSVAARGRAAAVASRRAARARRGGQVIGRRVMGRRVTAPSDRSEPIVARPQLTSKACGARLLVSVGGRHVARREDDKCACTGALHRPVERHSSRDRAWATKSGGAGGEVGRDSFRAFKSGFARSATLGLPRKALPAGKGATGAANSHLAGLLMFS